MSSLGVIVSWLGAVAPAAVGAPSTALPADPSMVQILEFQLVGLTIVVGALSLLSLMCATVGWFFQWTERARHTAKLGVSETHAVQAEPKPEPVTEIEDVPLVVIAAAVAATELRPHRVIEVKPAAVGWSLEGRRQLLTSHQIRR